MVIAQDSLVNASISVNYSTPAWYDPILCLDSLYSKNYTNRLRE